MPNNLITAAMEGSDIKTDIEGTSKNILTTNVNLLHAKVVVHINKVISNNKQPSKDEPY